MASDPKSNTQNQEEIDLLYLFVRFGEFIKNSTLKLINLIGSILVFLLKKWYYFAIALILTIATSLILTHVSDPYYHSYLTIRSNATHNQPIMSYLARLGEYADANNYAALSQNLNLSI